MKCLDCGYNIAPDEFEDHDGHDVIAGYFDYWCVVCGVPTSNEGFCKECEDNGRV